MTPKTGTEIPVAKPVAPPVSQKPAASPSAPPEDVFNATMEIDMSKEGMDLKVAPAVEPIAPAPVAPIEEDDEVIELELDEAAAEVESPVQETVDFNATMAIDMSKEGMDLKAAPAVEPIAPAPVAQIEDDDEVIELDLDEAGSEVESAVENTLDFNATMEIDMSKEGMDLKAAPAVEPVAPEPVAPIEEEEIEIEIEMEEAEAAPSKVQETMDFNATMAIDMSKEGMDLKAAPAVEPVAPEPVAPIEEEEIKIELELEEAEEAQPKVQETVDFNATMAIDMSKEGMDLKAAPAVEPVAPAPVASIEEEEIKIEIDEAEVVAIADVEEEVEEETPSDPAIGKLLLTEGVLTAEELAEISVDAPTEMQELISGVGGPKEEVLVALLGRDYTIPEVHLDTLDITSPPLERIPLELADMGYFPFAEAGCVTFIATPYVGDFETLALIRESSGGKIKVFQATAESVEAAVEKYYAEPPKAAPPVPVDVVEEVEVAETRPTQPSRILATAISEKEIQQSAEATQSDPIVLWERTYASAGPIVAERIHQV